MASQSRYKSSQLASGLESDELINIIISHDPTTERTVKVQRFVLTKASPYFAKALNSNFKEGQTKTLRFPGTDPRIVEYFLRFLFYDDAGMHGAKHPGSDPLLGIRLWVFGDQHMVHFFKNWSMTYLHKLAINQTQDFTIEIIHEALNNSEPSSPLWDLILGILLLGLNKSTSKQPTSDHPRTSQIRFETSDLLPLEEIPGFMRGLLDMQIKGHTHIPEGVKYMVDENELDEQKHARWRKLR